jgi:hypothetical protein
VERDRQPRVDARWDAAEYAPEEIDQIGLGGLAVEGATELLRDRLTDLVRVLGIVPGLEPAEEQEGVLGQELGCQFTSVQFVEDTLPVGDPRDNLLYSHRASASPNDPVQEQGGRERR